MGLRSVHAPSASHNCSGVARNCLSAKAARAAGLVSPSASAFSMRRSLAPSRSETRLDNLMWASSKRDSNWFCSLTRSRFSWYFLRVTVRHRRCSASGTKLKVNSRATSRLTRRSASRKSFLRPRGPRFDCACARCSVPDLRLTPSRFSRSGFQYRSNASQTGFQYWAVDSITASSTSCSSSHSASDRNWSGLLPNIRRSNWYSPSTSTSDTTTASILLWTSSPAILLDISSSWRERRACCNYLNQGRGLSPLPPREDNDAQLFAQTRTLRIKH